MAPLSVQNCGEEKSTSTPSLSAPLRKDFPQSAIGSHSTADDYPFHGMVPCRGKCFKDKNIKGRLLKRGEYMGQV